MVLPRQPRQTRLRRFAPIGHKHESDVVSAIQAPQHVAVAVQVELELRVFPTTINHQFPADIMYTPNLPKGTADPGGGVIAAAGGMFLIALLSQLDSHGCTATLPRSACTPPAPLSARRGRPRCSPNILRAVTREVLAAHRHSSIYLAAPRSAMTVLPSKNTTSSDESPPLEELRRLKSQAQNGEYRRQLRREQREAAKKAEHKDNKHPDPEPQQSDTSKPKRKKRGFFKWLFEPAVATSRKKKLDALNNKKDAKKQDPKPVAVPAKKTPEDEEDVSRMRQLFVQLKASPLEQTRADAVAAN
ncbi:hypothetical protein ON010_g13908 [Phytophthora cinnamomi]|nr:hypothetical protein ON010_g13908 [Phytophthora cinnamomi]